MTCATVVTCGSAARAAVSSSRRRPAARRSEPRSANAPAAKLPSEPGDRRHGERACGRRRGSKPRSARIDSLKSPMPDADQAVERRWRARTPRTPATRSASPSVSPAGRLAASSPAAPARRRPRSPIASGVDRTNSHATGASTARAPRRSPAQANRQPLASTTATDDRERDHEADAHHERVDAHRRREPPAEPLADHGQADHRERALSEAARQRDAARAASARAETPLIATHHDAERRRARPSAPRGCRARSTSRPMPKQKSEPTSVATRLICA